MIKHINVCVNIDKISAFYGYLLFKIILNLNCLSQLFYVMTFTDSQSSKLLAPCPPHSILRIRVGLNLHFK